MLLVLSVSVHQGRIPQSPLDPAVERVPACRPQSTDDKSPGLNHEPSHLPKRLLLVVGCFGLEFRIQVVLLTFVGQESILLGPTRRCVDEAVDVTTCEESRKSPEPGKHANADGEEQDGHEDAETDADPEKGEAQRRNEGEAEGRDGEAEEEDDRDEREDEVEENQASQYWPRLCEVDGLVIVPLASGRVNDAIDRVAAVGIGTRGGGSRPGTHVFGTHSVAYRIGRVVQDATLRRSGEQPWSGCPVSRVYVCVQGSRLCRPTDPCKGLSDVSGGVIWT